MTTINAVDVTDLRFPTSLTLAGSDAMNPDPDYSAAYLRFGTSDSSLVGHSFVFTIGRGNDVQAAAIAAAAQRFIGRDVDAICNDLAAANNELLWDSQLRWLGPDKGVMHMAIGAVMNALWDLRAQRESRPLWSTLAELTPRQVADLVDWTYLGDYLTHEVGRELLEANLDDRTSRIASLSRHGLPAYTTTPGWLGYSDEKLINLCARAVERGFTTIKLKVGNDIDHDRHRLRLARSTVGPDVRIAVDANQRWSVPEAIAAIDRLSEFDLRWVEEPTHPDDIVGHAEIAKQVAPVPIATGEHLANPVLAKQLLQLGGAQVLQIDATRVAGVHDIVAMLLLSAQANVPVIPHAGGVGLCEAVQHFAFFNAIALAAPNSDLALEHVDHLHEHMAAPVEVRGGAYRLPTTPGAGMAFTDAAVQAYRFPTGTQWATAAANSK